MRLDQALIDLALARYGKKTGRSPDAILMDAFEDDPDGEAYRAHFRAVADTARERLIRRCVVCGVEMEDARSTQKYCGPSCKPAYDNRPRQQKRCRHCKRPYTRRVREDNEKWAARRFCSPECVVEAGATRARGENAIQPVEVNA